jgi:hypothetical protein
LNRPSLRIASKSSFFSISLSHRFLSFSSGILNPNVAKKLARGDRF